MKVLMSCSAPWSAAARSATRWAQRGAAVPLRWLCIALVGWGAANAAAPTGPVGPVGPVGPIGPTGSAATPVPSPPARTQPSTAPRAPRPVPPQQPRAGDASAGNRIEVTGNTATGVRCSGDGAASVNSVDVSGARLDGRTVIVQGRNASDVDSTRDCPNPAGSSGDRPAAPGQTNSIRIR